MVFKSRIIWKQTVQAAAVPMPAAFDVAAQAGRSAIVSLLRDHDQSTTSAATMVAYTRADDAWGREKRPSFALPEAALPKTRPAIGDVVILPKVGVSHACAHQICR